MAAVPPARLAPTPSTEVPTETKPPFASGPALDGLRQKLSVALANFNISPPEQLIGNKSAVFPRLAVSAFQKAAGLKATGEINSETERALDLAVAISKEVATVVSDAKLLFQPPRPARTQAPPTLPTPKISPHQGVTLTAPPQKKPPQELPDPPDALEIFPRTP